MIERKYNITDKQVEKLLELAKTINIYVELDWEVTLCGNGTNANEAANCMHTVLETLGILQYYETPSQEEIRAVLKENGEDYADYFDDE